MQAVEFQTTWKRIKSAMPDEKRGEISGYGENDTVRVIVLPSAQQQTPLRQDLATDAREKGYDDFLEYLFDHPLTVPHPIRFSRDELHER